MNRVICVFIFVLYTSLISFAGEPSVLDILDVLAYGGFWPDKISIRRGTRGRKS